MHFFGVRFYTRVVVVGGGGGGGGKYEHLVTKVHEMKTLHTKAGCYTPPSLKVIEMMAHIALPTHN